MHIRPFLPRDHGEIAAISAAVDWGDGFMDLAFPRRQEQSGDVEALFVRVMKARECTAGVMSYVAETDQGDLGVSDKGLEQEGGKVVGSITVQRVGTGAIADRWRCVSPGRWMEAKLLKLEEWYVEAFRLNRAVDVEALKKHHDRVTALKIRPLKGKRFEEMWEVHNLVIDPGYQGRGVGSLLMELVMKQAQSELVPVGLRSSKAGKRFYEKLGFENLGDFGWCEGGKEVRQAWMAWLPRV